MRLYTNLWDWALPVKISINRFYHFSVDLLELGELDSMEFEFSILCFHVEFGLEFPEKQDKITREGGEI